MPIAFTLAFTEILKNVDDMREKARPKSQEFYKEEAKRRRRSDEDDRAGIRKVLEKCINHFQRDWTGAAIKVPGKLAGWISFTY